MLGEVLRHHLGRPPELLGLRELHLLLGGAAPETALSVADAEVVEPGLADGDGTVREVGVDPDLVDDGVVAEPELEIGVVLAAGRGVGDAVHARKLLLRLVLHAVEQRHAVERLVAQGADESFSGKQFFHREFSSILIAARTLAAFACAGRAGT